MSGDEMSREISRLKRAIRVDEFALRKARESCDDAAASAASDRITTNTNTMRELEIRRDRYA